MRRLILLMLALASAAPARGAVVKDTPTTSTWVTNGPVYAIAATSSTVYLGGQFTQVGLATGSGVPISAATGKPTDPFPKVKGTVSVCVADGAGGWFIGGYFNQVGEMPRNNLAHFLADGSVDPGWNPGLDGDVEALAVSGATVFVGGGFTTVGGQPRNCLAALDAATGAVTAWNPNATGGVSALVVSGGVVYTGGNFTSVGGQTRNHLAALDAASGALLAWNPNADKGVAALAVSGGLVYAGGIFTSVGGQPRNYLAALNATSGAATSWNANVTGYNVDALAISGGTLYVGGFFSSIGGQTRNNIAAVNAASGAATAWNPDANSEVLALAVLGGTIYAAGKFDFIGGQSRGKLAALDITSGMATAWNPAAIGTAYTVAAAGGTVYVGGHLICLSGQTRNNIAALDARTGVLTAWAPEANGLVQTLAVSGGVVYAGGDFTRIGGQSRSRLAALNTTNGAAIAGWNPGTINNSVLTLAAAGDTLYAGGDFTSVGGQTRNYLAALDAGTGTVKSWSPSASDSVEALTVSAGKVYAGGDFTSINGQYRGHLAALDASSGAVDAAWKPDCNGVVYALAASGGKFYVGGQFNYIDWQYHVNLAVLDAAGAVNASGIGGVGPVHALAIAGGKLFAGGENMHYPGESYHTLKAFDIASGALLGWRPAPQLRDQASDITILALAAAGAGTVYVGGGFTQLNDLDGSIQPFFAQFDTDPPAGAPTNPGAAALQTDSINWTWDYSARDADGFKVWADAGTGAPTTLRATAADEATSWTMNGLAANTQYTFQVAATNAAGDSARSAAYTTWTLIEPVTALTFPSVADTAMEVGTADTFSNVTAGLSGVYFSNDTQGTASGWVQKGGGQWVTWVNTGLTPNTLYAYRGRSRNGARISGAGASATHWTLAAASIGNNITCDKAPGAARVLGTAFTFSNPAGFGTGTHGGSPYKVSSYRWYWDTAPTHVPGGGDGLWNSGGLTLTPSIPGAYYLHLTAYNGAGAEAYNVLHYGPFTVAEAGRLAAAPVGLGFLEGSGREVNVERGGAPTFQSLTLTNTGGLPVVFTGGGSGTPGLALAGRCAGDYAIQSVAPATGAPLAPGGSVTVTIRFAPAETRRTLGLDAALRVTCDSPQTPLFDIPLLGDAVPVGLAGFRVE